MKEKKAEGGDVVVQGWEKDREAMAVLEKNKKKDREKVKNKRGKKRIRSEINPCRKALRNMGNTPDRHKSVKVKREFKEK